jgi:hypothetical protein
VSRIIIGPVLGAMLAVVSLRWGAEAEAKVVSFTVSNPVCRSVDLSANRCAINLRSLSITDDGTTPPFLTWAQILIDGRVRLRLTTFFEKSISYNSHMIPQGLGIPCGVPNESGLGAAIGKEYPVSLEPLDQSGASMGTDIANVICPAAVTTTSTTTATSTTTTTTSTTATTTSTLAAGPCDGIPSGATLASIDCRIQALLAAVEADGQLGGIQPKLVTVLRKARSREQDAQAKCAAGEAKHARKRLRQTRHKLAQVVHRLRSKASRKKLPKEVREQFAVEATVIRADTKTLQRALACPTG